MKILESGVEMTHEELRKSKAGKTCACGCGVGLDTNNMWIESRDGIGCDCGCTIGAFSSPGESAAAYIPNP